MPTNGTKLFSLSFLVKKIKFETDCVIDGRIAINVKFLRCPEQRIFEPFALPSCGEIDLNAGRSFMFGLTCDTASVLTQKFIIHLSLCQTDPEKRLSEAQVDVTRNFRDLFMGRNQNISRKKVS